MKRVISVLLSLLLTLGLSICVYAQDGLTIQITSAEENQYVVDGAELLSESELEQLNALAKQISQAQNSDVVIVTEYMMSGKSVMEYADDYFDEHGYGYGADRSGILLLISLYDRDWWISTRGSAIQAFTDDGIQYLWSQFGSDISNGDYARGFRTYLQTANTMLSAYNGTLSESELEAFQASFAAFTGDTRSVRHKPGIVKATLIALIIGFLLAFIPSSRLRSQLKSVRAKYDAASYERPSSLHLDRNRDIYLYAHTSSRVIETERSGGSGGSSTHISSSGATHGGGGGKF